MPWRSSPIQKLNAGAEISRLEEQLVAIRERLKTSDAATVKL